MFNQRQWGGSVSLNIEIEDTGCGIDVSDEANKKYPTVTTRLSPSERSALERVARKYRQSIATVVRETLTYAIRNNLTDTVMEEFMAGGATDDGDEREP